MEVAEMIASLKQRMQERAEQLLAQEKYALAAEAVSVLEALAKADRLLGGTSSAPAKGPAKQPAKTPSESSRTPDSEKEYPYFLRTDEELIKVGWSSKNEEEYLHRAPKSSVNAVCEAVERAADGRTAFSRDDLTGQTSGAGDGIPDYQVYLCLSWLRWAGLLNRVQRGKYAVPNLGEFATLWNRAWDHLPLEHLHTD